VRLGPTLQERLWGRFFCGHVVVFSSNPQLVETIAELCENMPPVGKDIGLFLLVGNDETRDYMVTLLREHNYSPLVVSDPGEMMQALKEHQHATVLLDCEEVSLYGPGIYSKIKVACQSCRIVLLCDKSHKNHRDIIKEAMEIGIYACLLAPFEGWEVLTMVRHGQAKKPIKKRLSKKKFFS
jgi:DNA-binding response OmpR family regulator